MKNHLFSTLITTLLSMFLLFLLLVGCNSGTTLPEDIRDGSTAESYEWMGKMHNDGLDYGIHRAGFISKVTSENVVAMTEEYLRESEEIIVEKGFALVPLGYQYIVEQTLLGRENFIAYLGECYSEKKISEDFYLFAMETIAFTWEEDLDGLERLAEQIGESQMDASEKAGICASLSIARGSIVYWSGVRETGVLNKQLIQWKRILLADAIGALAGAIAGSPGGVVGAGCGALGGAIGGSLGAWLL